MTQSKRNLYVNIARCFAEWFLMIFGITILVYSEKYHMFGNDDELCLGINYWLIVGGCLSIIFSSLSCCGIPDFFENDKTNCGKNNKYTITLDCFHISQFIIGIWAATIYHGDDADCKELIMDAYPAYWTFILIYYSIMWICVICLLFGCIFLATKCVKYNNDKYGNDNELLNDEKGNDKSRNSINIA